MLAPDSTLIGASPSFDALARHCQHPYWVSESPHAVSGFKVLDLHHYGEVDPTDLLHMLKASPDITEIDLRGCYTPDGMRYSFGHTVATQALLPLLSAALKAQLVVVRTDTLEIAAPAGYAAPTIWRAMKLQLPAGSFRCPALSDLFGALQSHELDDSGWDAQFLQYCSNIDTVLTQPHCTGLKITSIVNTLDHEEFDHLTHITLNDCGQLQLTAVSLHCGHILPNLQSLSLPNCSYFADSAGTVIGSIAVQKQLKRLHLHRFVNMRSSPRLRSALGDMLAIKKFPPLEYLGLTQCANLGTSGALQALSDSPCAPLLREFDLTCPIPIVSESYLDCGFGTEASPVFKQKFPELRVLRLQGRAVKHLDWITLAFVMPKLKLLDLRQSDLDAKGAKDVIRAFPNTRILHDFSY